MQDELKQLLQADMYRYYDKIPFVKPIQIKYIRVFRKASCYPSKSILGIYYRLKLKHLSEKTGIQIPTRTKIGKGFYIGHFGTIIINPEVTIGDNLNIAAGVTIGKTNRGDKMGVPTIGNKVWIGTNAAIVGKIKIGDDVLIAPNAYVNTDLPSHSIAIGNPAEIHHKDDATEGYINRIV